ncbi:MAG: protein TolQ [Deltaproteobacteria bacterium]|jgi:biopolymer transport protein TolQ|nr:protein TolQ [Deltaproteobacteria bacterium]MDL1976651.1 protein TolQ [Deltaproteobacteria bacterium]OEU52359.1 MAG: protein TolQ [Desulfobacterales bacterium C00003106]OEU60159.1 MAG: protein TolQ [Desulfobacterales bacterium C00003104]
MGFFSRTDVIHMILNSGPMVQFILFLLLSLSVVSWAIVFTKYTYFKKAQKESNRFIDVFWKSSDLTSVLKEAKNMRFSPVARTFRVGYREWARSYKVTSKKSSADIGSGIQARQTKNVTVNNVNRALKRSVNVELTRLNRLLAFLATTGNTAPFIGLFGTVWGIMNAFHGIGIKGSANLATVAPGISEALIATAAGLAAAIPAVVAFNYFTNRIGMMESELSNFSTDFLSLIERNTAMSL